MKEESCIFCQISNGEIKSEKIYENDSFFSILDINPKSEGHSLVISKRHFNNILDIPETLAQECFDCIKNTAMVTMKDYNSEGFNIINNNFSAAGQEVNHIHFHIVPRKKEDGLKFL